MKSPIFIDQQYPENLSLFEGDLISRLLARLYLIRNGATQYSVLLPVVICVCWIVPFILAAVQHNLIDPSIPRAFLYDPNLPAQTLVILLLLRVEPLVDWHVQNVGRHLACSGIVAHPEEYRRLERIVANLRHAIWPDILLFLVGCFIVFLWASASLHKPLSRWDVDIVNGKRVFTLAGLWFVVVFGPIFQFLWLRWLWKFMIWLLFLRGIARCRLRITPSHPDQSGGLTFLGEVQASFGILLFAVGIVVCVNIYRQIAQEHLNSWTIIGSAATFLLFAPIVLLFPLLLFSRQLYTVKHQYLTYYNTRLTQLINGVKSDISPSTYDRIIDSPCLPQASDMTGVKSLYEQATQMRIVPFNIQLLRRLLQFSTTPIFVLIIGYLPWPFVREVIEKLLGTLVAIT